ncbi:MAG: hypothetical protein U0175_36585 [Caldilineaceae bacterium]
MLYHYHLNGLHLQTGDIICTTDGTGSSLLGHFWGLVGLTIPGTVDHVALYVGPGGRCVEAAGKGVVTFDIPAQRWDAEQMLEQRGFLDQLVGVAYPLANRTLLPQTLAQIRSGVAHFCLAHAAAKTPYNPLFIAPELDVAYYCSQLIYKAYLAYGIDLSVGPAVTPLPDDARIVLPQAIWQNVPKRKLV